MKKSIYIDSKSLLSLKEVQIEMERAGRRITLGELTELAIADYVKKMRRKP
jgi:hypothetical protein